MKYLHIYKIKTPLDKRFYRVVELSNLRFSTLRNINYDKATLIKIIKINIEVKKLSVSN